jgi:hypothetical protein
MSYKDFINGIALLHSLSTDSYPFSLKNSFSSPTFSTCESSGGEEIVPLFLREKFDVAKKKAENEILIKFFLPSDMEIFLVLLTIRKKQHFEPSKCICSNGNVFCLISGFIPKRIKRLDFQFSLFAMVQFLMQFVH